jgi:hypothetical protein
MREIIRKREWTTMSVLILVAVILSAVAIFVPWWSINISPETSSFFNSSSMTINYYVSQTVTAVKSEGNETAIQSTHVSNLAEDPGSIWMFSVEMGIAYMSLIVGLGLSCLVLVLIALASLGRTPHRYLPHVGYIAAILLLISPFIFSADFPHNVSKFSTLTPVSPPSTGITLAPKNITGFWGNITIGEGTSFPTWAKSGNFWVWGADAGWCFALTASLLLFVVSTLIRTITKKKIVVG